MKLGLGCIQSLLLLTTIYPLIGSHNFDHRSDVLNTESGLIIQSQQLAKELTDFIKIDMLTENSWVIAPNKKNPYIELL